MEPKYEVATAYLAYSLRCFSEMASWLGHEEESRKYAGLAEKVTEAYRHRFLTNGKAAGSRMCQLVRPIALGLIADDGKPDAVEALAELVRERDYHIGTGFLSTPFVLPVLSMGGFGETAYRMLENRTYSSWLYEVKQGATTIWENWDGTASRNHYSNGAVCLWLFQTACGVRVAGENRFRIEPVAGGQINSMRYTYRSKYGKVSCGWEKQGEQIRYRVDVPAGCTADICLSKQEQGILEAGTYEFIL